MSNYLLDKLGESDSLFEFQNEYSDKRPNRQNDNQIYNLTHKPPSFPYFYYKNIYDYFNENDRKLAKLWAGDDSNIHTMSKMLSARGAELAAIEFYKRLGYQVEDVSIKQFDKNEREWINCDISLDNKIKIDVKNARTSINNPNGYSEVYVPQHKKDIKGNAVRIAGVLSPACDINLQAYCGTTQKITFLGETSLEEIQSLTQQSSSHGILELTLSRNGDKGFIAPWLFDYPEPFYRKRNAWRTEIAELLKREYDTVVKSLFSSDYYNAFIMSGIKLPAEKIEKFDFWTRAFYEKLILEDITSLTLPRLYLLVLTEFLEQAKKNPRDEYIPINKYIKVLKGYSPSKYLKFLYSSEKIHPLGIYDPLNIINELVDSLNILWTNKKYLDFSSFKGFKLTGSGILYGNRANETITLLAYCGGKIKSKKNARCGYTPLIYGREKTCSCGCLICPTCEFCSKTCYR